MRLLTLVFITLLAATAPALAAPGKPAVPNGVAAFSRSPVLPKWAEPLEPVPKTESEEPVVIRVAEVQYWAGPNPAHLVNRAVQVNSTSRLATIGQVSIPFYPAYQKLVLHRVAIMRGDQVLNRIDTANIRILDSENEVAQGMYVGESTAQLLLEDVKVGDTLWLSYSIHGRNPVFGAVWTEQLPWTKESFMELRKATILYPAGKPLRWRVSGAERTTLNAPASGLRNNIARLQFRETGLPANDFEPSTPPDLIPFSAVDISEYKDWNQVAQWATGLFNTRTAHPDIQALAGKFKGTPEERASQALHWIQDEIRYFSVSMGENSHRPQSPETVLRRRYGDCKDKSQLLAGLYRLMGLDAQLVLVNSSLPSYPARFLPSPGSFNHVIVRLVLDGKVYFVDPTRSNERGLISALPVATPKAAGLVVAADTSELTQLPDDEPKESQVDRREQLTIPTLQGEARLYLRTEYRGRYASAMRQAYQGLSSPEIRKYVLEQYERSYPGIQLDGKPVLSDTADGAGFLLEARLTLPSPLKKENGRLYLTQRTRVLEGTLGLPDKLARKHPLWLAAGRYRARYTLDATLPPEARLVNEDSRLNIENKNLYARSQLTWRGSHLNYGVDYEITNPEVAPSELGALSEEVRKLDTASESVFSFKPVDVLPQTAKEASLRMLDVLSKLSAYSELQNEYMSTGKLPDPKFDDSLYATLNYRAICESMINVYSVRQWNPVLAAPLSVLTKMMKSQADQRTKDLCGIQFLLADHQLINASKELAKFKPEDDDSLTLRQAWADFHADQAEPAKQHLARFVAAKSKAGTLSSSEALLALALAKRLGIDEPAGVIKLSGQMRQNAWPSPLFAMLRGQLEPAKLFALVEQLPAAAQEQAAMESHFYASQAYLASNQQRLAASHLNWITRYAVRSSDFEVLADADQYGAARRDKDMQAAMKAIAERRNASDIARLLQGPAERGIASAQFLLGSLYIEGSGIKKDVPLGISWLEKAAELGSPAALNDLGVLYADANGVAKDEARAFKLYRQAAEHGNAPAAYNLGRAYWFGQQGQPRDFDLSFRYMKDAAELERVDAQFFLSRLYFEGKGTEKNDDLARFWALQGFYRKDVDSSAQLGVVLLNTENDNKVREVAIGLLKGAAQSGNGFAMFEYARALLRGTGIQPDPELAFRIVERATVADNERAAALLGRMYVEGIGVRANVRKGLDLLDQLERKGLPEAYYQLGVVYRSDTAGLTDKKKAAEYFHKGAEAGQREAAEALAVMLHVGEGIPRDLPKAVQYYEQAVQAGYPRAMNNLAAMYEGGEGAPRNMDKARQLYRRAAQLGHPSAMLNLAELYEAEIEAKKNAFLPLAYVMLANRYGEKDAGAALERLSARADKASLEKARDYSAAWKPGKAMPEES